MLYDRDYMRDGERSEWRSPVVLLLVALVVLFLVECIFRVYLNTSLGQWFGLSYQAVRRHEYWRIVTYQFLHDAPWPWHILFNGIALWFFGRGFIEAQGTRRFWQVFFLGGFAGACFELACQAWHPRYAASWTVGASASVLGVAGAYCLLFPAREIVFFLYVFPVRLRAMTMFWLLLGFSVFGTVFPQGGIAHAAHLGGLLGGVAFVKWLAHEEAWGWIRRLLPKPRSRREEVSVAAGKAGGPSSGRAMPPAGTESQEDFIRREVDPILDKISAHGIHSLTDRERRTLQEARDRMKKR